MAHIPEQLRRQVAERAGHRCEYCHSNELFTGGPFHVEHVMPTARGGATEMDNLAYACARCNLQKGLRIYAVDPVSRRSAPLFNPRQHRWSLHFHWSDDGTRVIGRTRTGRGTIVALKVNHPLIVQARSLWVSCGIHPPDLPPAPHNPNT